MSEPIRPAGPGRKPSLAEFAGHPGVWLLTGPGLGDRVSAASVQPVTSLDAYVTVLGGYLRLDDIRDDIDWIAIGEGGRHVEVTPRVGLIEYTADVHRARALALLDSSVRAANALAISLKHADLTEVQHGLLEAYWRARGMPVGSELQGSDDGDGATNAGRQPDSEPEPG